MCGVNKVTWKNVVKVEVILRKEEKIPIVTSFSQQYSYYMQNFLIPREKTFCSFKNNTIQIKMLQKSKFKQLQLDSNPVWPNGWVFIYELSGYGFESSCSHLNFRFCACFKQGVPWHPGNYRVWRHSEMRTWHDKNIQLKSRFLKETLRLHKLMENRRIFKLEFYNLIFKENAITYHEKDQKSWFLLTERYMFSSF